MSIISKHELRITDSNGTVQYIEIDDLKERPFNLNLKVEIEAEKYGLNQVYLSFVPSNDVKLKYIDYVFVLNDKFADENLLCYRNGWNTNDWVKNEKFNDIIGQSDRCVTFLKNSSSGKGLGIGFITADRFWTYFKWEKNRVVLRYFMEDKAVVKGVEYTLEKFVFSNSLLACDFLEVYGNALGENYCVDLKKDIPVGWCSWSCFYKDISREKVEDAVSGLLESSRKINLLQLDDGWQDAVETFGGEWFEDTEKFPEGLYDFSKSLQKKE